MTGNIFCNICNIFYVFVDAILNSLKNRFEKNQALVQAFSLFASSDFPQRAKNFKTAHDLPACLNTFCLTYNLDAFRCADEFFNYGRSFDKFDSFNNDGGSKDDKISSSSDNELVGHNDNGIKILKIQ